MRIEDVRIGDRVLYLAPKSRCLEPKRVIAISTCHGGVHKVALAHSTREEFDDPDLKSSYLIYADPSMLFPENRPEVLDSCLRDFQHYLKQQIKAHYREQADLLHWIMCELCKENDTKGTLLEGEQCLRTLSKKALAMDFTFVDDFGVCTQDPFKEPAKSGYYWVVLWRVPSEGSALQRRVFETKEAAEDCLAKVQAMGMSCESPVQVWMGPGMDPGIGIYPPVNDAGSEDACKAGYWVLLWRTSERKDKTLFHKAFKSCEAAIKTVQYLKECSPDPIHYELIHVDIADDDWEPGIGIYPPVNDHGCI